MVSHPSARVVIHPERRMQSFDRCHLDQRRRSAKMRSFFQCTCCVAVSTAIPRQFLESAYVGLLPDGLPTLVNEVMPPLTSVRRGSCSPLTSPRRRVPRGLFAKD